MRDALQHDPDVAARFRPARAADLDRTVQRIGRDLGRTLPQWPGNTPVDLEPALLIELLSSWCGSN